MRIKFTINSYRASNIYSHQITFYFITNWPLCNGHEMSTDCMCSHVKWHRKWIHVNKIGTFFSAYFDKFSCEFRMFDSMFAICFVVVVVVAFILPNCYQFLSQFEHEMCAHINDRLLTAPFIIISHITIGSFHRCHACFTNFLTAFEIAHDSQRTIFSFIIAYYSMPAEENMRTISGNILRVKGFRRKNAWIVDINKRLSHGH